MRVVSQILISLALTSYMVHMSQALPLDEDIVRSGGHMPQALSLDEVILRSGGHLSKRGLPLVGGLLGGGGGGGGIPVVGGLLGSSGRGRGRGGGRGRGKKFGKPRGKKSPANGKKWKAKKSNGTVRPKGTDMQVMED